MLSALATIGLFLVVAICADILTHPTSDRRPSTTVGSVRAPRAGEGSTGAHRDYSHPVFDIEVTR